METNPIEESSELALVNAETRLRKSADDMMRWDLPSFQTIQLRGAFREFVDHYKERVLYTRALKRGVEALRDKVRADEATSFIGTYLGLKKVTVYSWISETQIHSPLTWERFSLLIQREWALSHPEERFSKLTEAYSARYLQAMEMVVPPRKRWVATKNT